MAKKQFKTESKRILDLMINSIYTHKEIFLRELISNASDAIDKLCYISLTDDSVGLSRSDFKITVAADKEKRTITISDNGVGMSADELENNLGVIAKSGSLQFKNELEEKEEKAEEIDIIGQFGVGFYSAFMVASKVSVTSKKYGEEGANTWVSQGADGYTITPSEKETAGTDIVIELKEDSENENYSDFLEEFTLRRIIKKYSDYIRWPIVMDITKSRVKEDSPEDKPEYETYTEKETVNSMVPIWQRPKNEVSDDECKAFYKEKFYDMTDPVSVIRINAEGTVSYKAMLFIPGAVPFDYYTNTYEPGLQLYTSGVMIMDKCSELLPEHFRFVRGIVDSQDLSLNISREMLQHDRQLKTIANSIEKKIKSELKRLMESDPEKYAQFYKAFGLQLKYGIVANYGMKKDLLSDLLLFFSHKEGRMISLKDYVDHMLSDQKYIYYACAENTTIADGLPQTEPVKDRGYDILYLTDNVDEFAVQMLNTYLEKPFKSVNDEDLGLESEEEKEQAEKAQEENKELLDFVVSSLGGKIAESKISHKLKSHPVCLTTRGAVTLEMEKYFNSVPTPEGEAVKAERVLELNADHPAFASLKNAYENDREKAEKYARLLYFQSQLIAGDPIENPAEFAGLVCELMA